MRGTAHGLVDAVVPPEEIADILDRALTSSGYATALAQLNTAFTRKFILRANAGREQNHIGFKMAAISKIHAIARFGTGDNFVGGFLRVNFYTDGLNFTAQ